MAEQDSKKRLLETFRRQMELAERIAREVQGEQPKKTEMDGLVVWDFPEHRIRVCLQTFSY